MTTITWKLRRSASPARLATALLLLAVLVAAGRVEAAGELDSSFGRDGKVLTRFSLGHRAEANSVALDAKGRIVAAGGAADGASQFFALARYKRNGHLDRSFGRDGKVTTKFGRKGFGATGVAIDSRDRIVAIGSTGKGENPNFALARYKPNGHLDRSFSGNGRVTTDLRGFHDQAESVAIDSRGRIVVAGSTGHPPTPGSRYLDWDFALVRYTRDGRLDPSFGTGGKVVTDFGSFFDFATAVAIDSDDRTVVGGSAVSFTNAVVARYRQDGSLDPTFGTGGEATADFGDGYTSGRGLAIDSSGRIVTAGAVERGNRGDLGKQFALARFTRDGDLDPSFGTDGRVTTDLRGFHDQAESVAIDSRGRIVAAGHTGSEERRPWRVALARYRRNGNLDRSFFGNGKVTRPHGLANAGVIDSRGRIVTGGRKGWRFEIVRFIG
jgi:uncharacterized delta-60 repeat protein